VQAGEQCGHDGERVRYGAAERARVQVDVRPVQVDLAVGQPAHPGADRGGVPVEHAGVTHDHHVAAQPVAVVLEQLAEVRRAGLLLALDDDLQRHGGAGPAGDRQVRLQPEQVEQHLTLVVDGPAREQLVADDRRLERRGLPQLDRIDRLHVVVAVEHDDRRVRVLARPLGEHRRQAVGLPDLHRREPGRTQSVGQPLRAAPYVGFVLRRDADGRDAQPRVEVGVQLAGMVLHVRRDDAHGIGLHGIAHDPAP
jgi:hypothetical protein